MSKNCREESKTGFYHVMVRGVNRQKIFCDSTDRKFFIHLLKKNVCSKNVEVHAFCLMENHVHLLLKAEKHDLSSYMRDVLTIYAMYFNKKVNRCGHLFENRFKSEPINDEIYYLTVLRYILQNPEKAFICRTNDYPWSSIGAYTKDSFVTTDFVLSLFSSVRDFKKFVCERNNDECLDLDLTSEEKDLKAKIIIKYLLGDLSVEKLKELSKNNRNHYIREMKKNDITIRRISKITGLSLGIVQKA